MAERALAGGDPVRAFYQSDGELNRASACEAECCGDCRLWWLATPCPVPEPDPNDPCPGTISGGGAPSSIIVAQDSVCVPQGVVQPGWVILWNGYCYTITNQVRRRPEDTGCPDTVEISTLPPVEGVLICTSCSSQLCYQFTSGYAVAIPCDAAATDDCGPIRFCRRELVDLGLDCVYIRIGCNTPGTSWCYKFALTNPDSTDPNARTVSVSVAAPDPDDRFVECCECEASYQPPHCVREGLSGFSGVIPPEGVFCCCGTPEEFVQQTRYIIDEDTFIRVQTDPFGNIYRIESRLFPAPQVFTVTGQPDSIDYRQITTLNGQFFSSFDFQVGFQFGQCSPLARVLQNSPPWGNFPPDTLTISTTVNCDSVTIVASWTEGTDDVSWRFSARLIRPLPSAPCAGTCSGTIQRLTPEVVRWLGMDWYGTPYPVKLWNRLLGKKEKTIEGCGCVKRLKDWTLGWPKIIGDWRG